MVNRLSSTDEALSLIAKLKETHGELMFYQAGGCCEAHNLNVLKKVGFIYVPTILH